MLALPPVMLLTCQVTALLAALVTEAENDWLAPVATVATLGETLTCACAIVTVAESERVASALATAVTITVAGVGMVSGALYRPAFEIVPTLALPPITPFTSQTTAVFDPALNTAALKLRVAPRAIYTLSGDSSTATGGEIVTPEKPVALGSCADTAITDTVDGVG